MAEFSNVSVIKKANIYFDGKVTSRTLLFADGTRKTLGIMLPGDYEFGTDSPEIIEILAGDLDVLLPGFDDWQTFGPGDSFEIAANEKFSLRIRTTTDYCCSYGD